jgi:hypothetical protein
MFLSIIGLLPMILSFQYILDNICIASICKPYLLTPFFTRCSVNLITIFVLYPLILLIVRLLAGLYLLSYTLPPMTLSDTLILCMIRHAETMLLIIFNKCPRKGLVIT